MTASHLQSRCLLVRWLLLALLVGGALASATGSARAQGDGHVISLAGEWRFSRGEPALEPHPGALPALNFTDHITLPGTTDTNKKGPPSGYRATDSLTQPYNYVGVCWYQQDIVIPEGWRNKRVTLLLERTKYTQVWLDGRAVGEQAIFLTPQEYELGHDLAPGRHVVTIAVDNRRLPPYGSDAHMFSGNTQGNWNGIIGRIELRMTDLAWIADAEIVPNAAARQITVKLRLTNSTPGMVDGTVALQVKGPGVARTARASAGVHWPTGETNLELTLGLGPEAARWDEFHPVLQALTVRLAAAGLADERRIAFGLRNFTANGHQFAINGQPTFLRGRHDACVFPLTGHPPMDVAGWLNYFHICQSYGLNHIRFHTWTPPEAAFTAADQVGFYLQPELPFWGAFNQPAKAAWEPEAKRLLSQFGNHPSFVMLSMGNEPWGGADVLADLVADLRAYDPRILYVRGANGFSADSRPGLGDDHYIGSDLQPVASGPRYQIRGANGGAGAGHIQTGPANTLTDYAQAISTLSVPVVTHEMGQYTVYPDFQQISKYTGATVPYNLERFQKNLAESGMADEDAAFAQASGALAALCYREEIESCLRTPQYGGFELLDLQDFSGQGTALVGMLDAFMDSKGIVTPEQWRQFCAPMVLLARFPKYAWTADETFTADVELAQYGAQDVSHAALAWQLKDASGKTLLAGKLPPADYARGGLRTVGKIALPLQSLRAPAQLRLELALTGTSIATSYPLWVYPPKVATLPPANVTLVRAYDADAQKALAAGGRVLLVCDQTNLLARTVGGGFAPDFWNYQFFHNKPGTMGLLCDPASPALSLFPTEPHSDWQWFPIAYHAQPLVLDRVLPAGERPLVQVIDNYARCHKLGLVFEMKSGAGRLLVCAADLIRLGDTQPAARQLLASLLAYAGSASFNPATDVSDDALRALFRVALPMNGCQATASGFDPGWQGYGPSHLIDGNEGKEWRADPKARNDVWCQVEFPRPTDLGACEILWNQPGPGYQYLVQCSTNATDWQTVSDQRQNTFASARQLFDLKAAAVKGVRVIISGTPHHRPAGIGEIRFFPPE